MVERFLFFSILSALAGGLQGCSSSDDPGELEDAAPIKDSGQSSTCWPSPDTAAQVGRFCPNDDATTAAVTSLPSVEANMVLEFSPAAVSLDGDAFNLVGGVSGSAVVPDAVLDSCAAEKGFTLELLAKMTDHSAAMRTIASVEGAVGVHVDAGDQLVIESAGELIETGHRLAQGEYSYLGLSVTPTSREVALINRGELYYVASDETATAWPLATTGAFTVGTSALATGSFDGRIYFVGIYCQQTSVVNRGIDVLH